MAPPSSSYLTRRQKSYAANPGSHNNPHRVELFSTAALVSNHERGSLQPSQGGGGRNRRRGSPFAALSEAYKPPRAAGFTTRGGRDRGEVLGLRSSNFSWPSVERLPADPRHFQRPRGEKSAVGGAGVEAEVTVASGAKKPTLLLVRKRTDENAVESRWVSSSSSSPSSSTAADGADGGGVTGVVAGVDVGASPPPPAWVAAAKAEAAPRTVAAAADTTTTTTATPPSLSPPRSSPQRRSVSWGKNVVHEFDIHADQTQADVYSPDLLAVEIAKDLAVLARDPELRRAASAVELCRRYASHAVRSLTAEQNGGVEGVEDACRLCNWREAAFLREMDELVRCIVVTGGQKEVWRLKASYRAARRRMEDDRTN
ncbi:unnamed protein product [Pylaiella littoralis]